VTGRTEEALIVVETRLDDVTGELLGELPGLPLQAGPQRVIAEQAIAQLRAP
jgi:uncharacterized protein (DUF111 family)